MILGLGIDLVDSVRIEKLMQKHGVRFLEKYFTETEIAHINAIDDPVQKCLSLAKRFAAKEACAKALGTGFRDGLYMKDIGVSNDALGKPALKLDNGAQRRLTEITPADKQAVMHLSMTDEPPYAQAQVIIEGI